MKKLFLILISIWLVSCLPAHPTPTKTIEQPLLAVPNLTHPNSTHTALTFPTSASSPSASVDQTLALRQVSQMKEKFNDIVVSGDVAYVGLDQTIAVIDISQHEIPRVISKSESRPGDVSLLLLIPGEPDPFLFNNDYGGFVLLNLKGLEIITQSKRII